MDNITNTMEPFPELKLATDALFGESAAPESLCDTEPYFRILRDEEVNFFNLPLMAQLNRRPYHRLKLKGSFHLGKLVRDHHAQLFRSESQQAPQKKTYVERLFFSLGDWVFAVYDAPDLMVYAPTPQAVAEAVAQMRKYRKPERKKPGFQLVSLSGGQPSAVLITIQQAAPVNDQELALHYGPDFLGWERTWINRLRQRRSGVSILYGPPGCGKTSYLRSLMARLIHTFEFYYIPVSAFDVLSNPNFVTFWNEQKNDGRDKHRIAILEDAEDLLLPRNEGSQTKVANLLNIGDGFLGEHLNLHVVATTNSPMRQLDPALLRPGRLMGTREFRRLTRGEAQSIAEAKGFKLADQPDYSLGEIYCGAVNNPVPNSNRKIGFTP